MTTPQRSNQQTIRLSAEVADAFRSGRAVVGMESTIYSSLGLPAPHNLDALRRCEAAIRGAGAIPAVTAVLDGVCCVGIEPNEVERVLAVDNKVSARDLPVVMARGGDGVTTVAASVTLCSRAGVSVFATGGMGGVHRGAELSGDISADLGALRAEPVLTVTAGAKAFLDLSRTLEYLDTLGVPVLGFGTDEFPAFYSRSSGVAVPHRVDSAAEAAAIYLAGQTLGYTGGVVVANPIPAHAEIPAEQINPVIDDALSAAERVGAVGAAVTPFVLAAIAEATEGRSIPANLALAESNARVAAEIAVAITHQRAT